MILAWHLGENRLLKAGGLLDQPAMHFRVSRAAYVWDLLKEISKKDFKPSDLGNEPAKLNMVMKLQEMRAKVIG